MKYLFILIFLVLIGVVFFLNVDCDDCQGAGTIDDLKKVQVSCPVCKGAGKRSSGLSSGLKGGTTKKLGSGKSKCLKCRGSGTVEKMVPVGACSNCEGSGKIKLRSKLMGFF